MRKFIQTHRNKSIIIFHHITLIYGLSLYNFEWPYVLISIASAYLCFAIFAHSTHHLISHKIFTPAWWKYVYLYFLNTFTAMGGAFNFTVLHRHHHKYYDTDKDPHSPIQIGWWRVYLLLWKNTKPNPVACRDLFHKPVLFLHTHQVKLHFLSVIIFYLIDPRLVFFILSPSIVYTFHVNGLVNWRGHRDGVPRNIPEIAWLTPLSWNHGDHHEQFEHIAKVVD